jgi:AraC family transcriptional regulator
MDYIERIQKAVDYIESHLFEPINLKTVADQAFCSLYHFHRYFKAISDYSLKEYIRKRRLIEVSEELRNTDKNILELAFKCQFESQESFSRAFKKEFGRNPGDFRKKRASFRSFPALDIKSIHRKGVRNMKKTKPKIITRDQFLVIGPAIRTTVEKEENFKQIPLFWEKTLKKSLLAKIPNRVDEETCYGICMEMKDDGFTYMIGCEVKSLSNIPDNMIGRTIPGATYAVFTARGPITKSVQDTTAYIYKNWFPESGYEHAYTPEFELYDKRSMPENEDEAETDIYIPVKKKNQE